MFEWLGITPQGLVAQLLVGLINGSFYAILSLGLAIIFGLLNVINFTHGAQYMLGAMLTWIGLTQLGGWLGMPEFEVNYFFALILAPLLVGLFSIVIEKTMLKRLYHLDHLYGLLLTFGLALVIEGLFRHWFGVLGNSYPVPDVLKGGIRVGELFLPYYRLWVVFLALIVCFATWYFIERTSLGSLLRAGTEFFPALEAACAAAQREIYLETYIFEDDATGQRVGATLARAAARGVAVHVMIDAFGSNDLGDDFLLALRAAGVRVLKYRPEISPWTLRRERLRRLHRKIAVVDARIAFVGGINIIDDMHTPGHTPPRYDYSVKIEGPLVDPVRAAPAPRQQRLDPRPLRIAQPVDLRHDKLPAVWKLESHLNAKGNPY